MTRAGSSAPPASPAPARAAIQLHALTKAFGRNVAVNGLSLCIREGEIFGLLGPNGAGKSTTLYMCTGLVRPTAGSVRILGRDVQHDPLHAVAPVGSLIEEPAFCEYLSARANLTMIARLAGPGTTVEQAADAAGLSDRLDDRVRAYSHGMKQRLGIAQALLGRPRILILDEPTSGLDPEGTRDLLQLLKDLARKHGLTVVLSSHLLNEVEDVCDRVAVIRQGQLVACGRVDDLLAASEDTVLLRVHDAVRAAEVANAQDYVLDAVAVDSHHVEAKLAANVPERLNAALVGAGVEVAELSMKRPTLHEFFFRVAGADGTRMMLDDPIEDPASEGPAEPAPSALPSWPARLATSARNEWTKCLGQKLPYIIGALVVAVVLIHFIGNRLTGALDAENGFSFVVLSVQVALGLVGSVFLLAFGAMMVAGELNAGSARMFLCRPQGRSEYFLGKAVAALVAEVAVIALSLAAAFAFGSCLASFGDLTDGDVVLYTRGALLRQLLVGCAACVVTLYGSISFGLMISAWCRSTGVAVSAAIGLYLFMDVAKHVLRIDAYMFSTYLDAPLVRLHDMTDGLAFAWGRETAWGLGVCAVSTVVFLAVGLLGLWRRDLND